MLSYLHVYRYIYVIGIMATWHLSMTAWVTFDSVVGSSWLMSVANCLPGDMAWPSLVVSNMIVSSPGVSIICNLSHYWKLQQILNQAEGLHVRSASTVYMVDQVFYKQDRSTVGHHLLLRGFTVFRGESNLSSNHHECLWCSLSQKVTYRYL